MYLLAPQRAQPDARSHHRVVVQFPEPAADRSNRLDDRDGSVSVRCLACSRLARGLEIMKVGEFVRSERALMHSHAMCEKAVS